MDMDMKIEGLDEAMRALQAAFPKNPKRQRQLLNQAMSQAARQTIIKHAKQKALEGDKSGSLSAAIKPRAVAAGKARAAGAAARVHVTPVRYDAKAMALYINYYKPELGKIDGIRHGHLVEFGHRKRGGRGFVAARPFMGPAIDSAGSAYVSRFASNLKRKVELAVKRARKR